MEPGSYEVDPWDANPYAAPLSGGAKGDFGPQEYEDDESASRWLRLAGSLLDYLFLVAAFMLLFIPSILLVPGAWEGLFSQAPPSDAPMQLIPIGLGWLGVLTLSIAQWVLISNTGQSLGKKAVGIRIIKVEDGEMPGFVHGVLLRQWVRGLISAVPCFGAIFQLVDPLFIFGEERRCLHDYMAQTRVVKATAGEAAYDQFDDAEFR